MEVNNYYPDLMKLIASSKNQRFPLRFLVISNVSLRFPLRFLAYQISRFASRFASLVSQLDRFASRFASNFEKRTASGASASASASTSLPTARLSFTCSVVPCNIYFKQALWCYHSPNELAPSTPRLPPRLYLVAY